MADNKIDVSNKIWEQMCAILYIKNSDKTKYGSLWKGLNTQNSLSNNQYPKMITEANKVLNRHICDSNESKSNKKKEKSNNNNNKVKMENEEEDKLGLLFAQMEGRCWCYRKAGHKSPSCRFKDKPKEEWAMNKAGQSHIQKTIDTKMS